MCTIRHFDISIFIEHTITITILDQCIDILSYRYVLQIPTNTNTKVDVLASKNLQVLLSNNYAPEFRGK